MKGFVDCPHCGGRGYFEDPDGGGQDKDCEVCLGTGTVDAESVEREALVSDEDFVEECVRRQAQLTEVMLNEGRVEKMKKLRDKMRVRQKENEELQKSFPKHCREWAMYRDEAENFEEFADALDEILNEGK